MTTRMTSPRAAIGLAAALALLSASLLAHHNLVTDFSMNKPVSLRGTLTKLEWINPHGWIHLRVKSADGQVEDWAVETGSPYVMEKRGLRRTDFTPGAELIVTGYQARDGSRTAAGMVVTFPDREKSPDQESSFTLGR